MTTYIVPIPDDMPPLNMNVRMHWAPRNRLVQQWRTVTAAAVRRRQVPSLPRCTFTLHVTPPDRRRRDSGNYVATHKAALDGLVDAGVVPDDSPEFVEERMPYLHEPDGSKRWKWWLVVEALEAAA